MKKYFFVIINIFTSILLTLSFAISQFYFTDNSMFTVLNSPEFKNSKEFSQITKDNIKDLLYFLRLKNIYEINDSLNYNAIIATSTDFTNTHEWTIGECLKKCYDHSLTIDSNYEIFQYDKYNTVKYDSTIYNFSKENILNTSNFKQFNDNINEEKFLYEFLNSLSFYYRFKNKFDTNNSNFYYSLILNNENYNKTFSNTTINYDDFFDKDAFFYSSGIDSITSSNIKGLTSEAIYGINKIIPTFDDNYVFYCYVDTSFTNNDSYKEQNLLSISNKELAGKILVTDIFSLILFFLSFFIVLYLIFNTKKDLNIKKSFLTVIPTEVLFIITIIFVFSLLYIINNFNYSKYIIFDNIFKSKFYLYILTIYTFAIILLTILSSKYSADTLTPFFYNKIKDNNKFVLPTQLIFLSLIPLIIICIVSIYLIYFAIVSGTKALMINGFFILISLILFSLFLLFFYDLCTKSLQEQKHSSDLRTSLITNVTHDIKTPLTSIVNYSGLIAKEVSILKEDSKEKLIHYSNVISEKTEKLNMLIDELIYESKVSSGNIDIEWSNINIVEFIEQSIVEFEDRFNQKNLKIVFNKPAKDIFIKADGSKLFRIFQNFYTNIEKYALDGTRVYIDIEQKKNTITIIIKNISNEELEENPHNLKERFVRGSKSRSSEGFGLGLSIADKLIELMKGKFEVKSDKDEFITKVTFLTTNAKN